MTNPIAPPVDGVSADTDRLATFVDGGRRYRADLIDIRDRVVVARRRVSQAVGAGPVPTGATTLADLLAAAEATTDFVDAVRAALIDVAVEGFRPVLRRSVLDGRLPPPSDDLRRRILASLLAGRTPSDVGIDPAYFPAVVVRHHDLSRRIEELEAARDRADGLPLVWWDGDHDEVAAIDRRLDELRTDRQALADHGIDVDGSIDPFDAVALVAADTGGQAWEGRFYASAFTTHRADGLAAGGPFGFGRGALADVGGFALEFDHLAERVAADTEVAVAFYRELGPAATADLPTFVIGADGSAAADGDVRTMRHLSLGLAAASRSLDAGGSARLGFGGDELLTQPRPSTHTGVIGYSPALLFADGRFDPDFLADATVAALRLAAVGDVRGHIGHHGWRLSPVLVGSTHTTYDGGEDPRNILLSRASERPETVRAVLEGLAGGPGRPVPASSGGPPDGPGPDAFGALLRPAVPFEPTVGPGGSDRRHWLDRLRRRGNREGADLSALSPLAYPDLPDPYPITGFLGAVAADDELSRWLLRAVATRAELAGATPRVDGAVGSVIGDPGVAAGLDLILGAHATTMLDPDALTAVGLEASGLNEGSTRPVGPAQWRAAVDEVRRWGRGQALAQATAGLLTEAIGGAIDADGRFEVAMTRPFAHLAGRAETEAHQAVLAYAAGLDDEARARNRLANLTASAATTGAGFLPGGGVVAAPAGVGWVWFFEGYPTDAELRAYRRLWGEHHDEGKQMYWEQAVLDIWLDRRVGSWPTAKIEVAVPDLGVGPVDVRRSPGPGRFEWRHPDDDGGTWTPLPRLGQNGGFDLFPAEPSTQVRAVIAAAQQIDVEVENGVESGLQPGGRPPDDDAADWTGRWLARP